MFNSLSARSYIEKQEVSHYKKVNDKMAFAVAGFYGGQNGFFRNQYDGSHADLINEFGGKGRLLWKPTDRLNFDLIADYQYTRQNGFPYGQVVTEDEVAAATITSPLYGLKAVRNYLTKIDRAIIAVISSTQDWASNMRGMDLTSIR